MSSDLPPMSEAISHEDIVLLKIGSTNERMSCKVKENSAVVPSREWKQPVPDEMTWAEAGYYALIKGLRMALEMDYSKAIVRTHYQPITEKIKADATPSDDLMHPHETAVQLIEQFDEIDLNPKPWER